MKLKSFLIVSLCLFGFTVNSYAVLDANTNEGDTAGEAIRLTDGTNELVLNFSPSVNALYLADTAGTAGNRQWYAVAAYHSGGKMFHASSSDSTGVYKQDRGANETFSQVEIPTSSDMTAADAEEGEEVTAEEYWLDNGWSK